MKISWKILVGGASLMMIFASGYAQKKDIVVAHGDIQYHNRIPLPGATLRLTLDGREVDKVITGETAEYRFDLEYNKEYILEISKEGLVSKKVKYNTLMPPKFSGEWWIGIPINLYELCDNVEPQVFDEPVALVEFNEKRKEYQANPKHHNYMSSRVRAFEDENNRCLDNKFEALLNEADKLLKEKKYEEAQALYSEADSKRPWEYYAADQLLELDDLLAKSNASDQLYDNLIKQADNQFKQGSLVAAKNSYKRASLLKPNEKHPVEQIALIDSKLAEGGASAAPDRYEIIIKQADNAFDGGNVQLAETLYKQAIEIRPGERYPQSRLTQLDNQKKQAELESQKKQQELLASKEEEQKFNQLLTSGDAFYEQGNYDQAVAAYTQALEINPSDGYTKSRLSRAEKQLADKKKDMEKINQEYLSLIQKGDALLSQKNYQEAKQIFSQAQALKPSENTPKEKLTQIETALQNLALEKQEKAQQSEAYRLAVQEGNTLLAKQDFDGARTAFTKALEIKPNDPLVAARMKELQTQKAVQEKRLADEADQKVYTDKLKLGNSLMAQNKLNEAKQVFQDALTLKPDETYPQAQIRTIDTKLNEIRAEEERQLAREEAYKNIMAQANRSFEAKDYYKARSEYNQALSLKPADNQAAQRLNSINQILEQQKQKEAALQAKEREYNQWIEKADQLYQASDLPGAQKAYQQAIILKPASEYPSAQIEIIASTLELQEQERLAQREREDNYNKILASADGRYNQSDYVSAKELYADALRIKPDEKYPKARITQIEELLSKIQTANKSQPQVTEVEEIKLPELKFSDATELELYLVKVAKQYPPGITHEVYKSKRATTNRYIIIRDNKASEFREIVYNWGSEHSVNGKPCTVLFFKQQTKKRPNEYYKRVEK